MRFEQSLAGRESPDLDLLGVLAPDAAPERSGQGDPAPQDIGPGAQADQAGGGWADASEVTTEDA